MSILKYKVFKVNKQYDLKKIDYNIFPILKKIDYNVFPILIKFWTMIFLLFKKISTYKKQLSLKQYKIHFKYI